MVRIVSLALTTLAMAFVAQACTQCQCLFSDGSHCCVVESNSGDCATTCKTMTRGKDDKPCNANGDYVCISYLTSLGRMSCSGDIAQ